jgi:hypothetical protein
MHVMRPAANIPGFRRDTVAVNSVRLHYWLDGDPDGAPVILWHGAKSRRHSLPPGSQCSSRTCAALRRARTAYCGDIRIAQLTINQNKQNFFGSFFQKRTEKSASF